MADTQKTADSSEEKQPAVKPESVKPETGKDVTGQLSEPMMFTDTMTGIVVEASSAAEANEKIKAELDKKDNK